MITILVTLLFLAPIPPIAPGVRHPLDTQNITVFDNTQHDLFPVEVQMYQALNKERESRGLKPLSIDTELQAGCRKWAGHMATTSRMVHDRGVTENIATGQKTAQEVTQTWMHSTGHRRNMLGNHTKCGVAGYVNSLGQIYWVQRFR